ncbi:MAG: IS30 family transposase [Clostridia bacterium]|nr:IS30 family transposase [Clostridia bacterium]
MNNHLTLADREKIQDLLKEGLSFGQIATEIGKCKTTVSREIKAYRKYVSSKDIATFMPKNVCVYRYECDIKNICKSSECFYRTKKCKVCGKCNEKCEKFKEDICIKHDKPPYVCNGCDKKVRCQLSKYIYSAKDAHNMYLEKLSESRSGITLSEEELNRLDKIISPKIKKGQSVRNICIQNRDDIMLSDKTIYKYIHERIFEIDDFALRRKLSRKPRKKQAGPQCKIDKKCRENRTYDDFLKFMAERSDTPVFEMDTVEGIKGGKVLLTLLFRNCNLQLYFIREANTAGSVTEIFDSLRQNLTEEEFNILFPVILTDRGSEFSNPTEIEINKHTGIKQTHVFYCDPKCSEQKAQCERNHEFVRYYFAKGKSFDILDEEKTILMTNHINSYGRRILNDRAPIDIFIGIYGEEIAKKLSLRKIPADVIILNTGLFE